MELDWRRTAHSNIGINQESIIKRSIGALSVGCIPFLAISEPTNQRLLQGLYDNEQLTIAALLADSFYSTLVIRRIGTQLCSASLLLDLFGSCCYTPQPKNSNPTSKVSDTQLQRIFRVYFIRAFNFRTIGRGCLACMWGIGTGTIDIQATGLITLSFLYIFAPQIYFIILLNTRKYICIHSYTHTFFVICILSVYIFYAFRGLIEL